MSASAVILARFGLHTVTSCVLRPGPDSDATLAGPNLALVAQETHRPTACVVNHSHGATPIKYLPCV